MPKGPKYAAVNEASRKHGERLKKTRLAMGMSQPQVAALFGINVNSLARLEKGYFNISNPANKHKLLNEKMRIWAEMNKRGIPKPKKEKYVSRKTIFWQNLLKKRKEENERKDPERSIERDGDQGDHPAGDRQAAGR